MTPSELKEMAREELLEALHASDRGATESWLAAIGIFAAGLAVGTGLGVLFAPRLAALRERAEEAFEEATGRPPGSQPH